MEPYSFIVDGRPHPKERPRTGRNGHVYTPRKSLDAEGRVGGAYEGPVFPDMVEVDMEFHDDHTLVVVREFTGSRSKLRGDVDNYEKTVLDGLNGVAWVDDRLVMATRAVKK